ncbi:MAG: ATP-binding protein [Gammaproteobacteria bacterium]
MNPPITTKATAILNNLLRLDNQDAVAAEQLFLKAAIALSSARRDDVFDDLAHSLAELLDVDIAMISVVEPGGPRDSMEALSLWMDGHWVRGHRYALAGTPCETVLGREFRFYAQGVHERFDDPDIRRQRIEGYAGVPLVGTDGTSLGVIAVMTLTRMLHAERIEALLRIFSERVVVEIERSRTESALKASEELYGAVFNAALDGIAMITTEGEIVDVNPALVRMSGFSREELLGRSVYEFVAKEAKARDFYASVVRDGRACNEGKTVRKDGTPWFCEYRATLVHFRGRPHCLQMVRDITERKEADDARNALEAQLRHAQRMEAIGQLTGGIAHDFNNILTGLLGYVEVAKEHAEALNDPRLSRYLDRAHRSGLRARTLVQQMLTFSRGQRGQARPVDLAQITREMMALLESTLPSSITLEKTIPERLPTTVLDPIHFEQILLNLVINSRDAMDGVGKLAIALTERRCTDCFCCASCRLPIDGAFVELAITDNGPGIPPDVQQRMFEPFFSTKESGKGTGMGLAIVHGIVHEYGGHLVVRSELGQGTKISILLPCDPDALSDPVADPQSCTKHAVRPLLAGRALCVDDNPEVAEFMQELLQGWGLDVVRFEDSLAARAHFESHPDDFDFVLLDQTMPGMTGLELAAVLLSQRPELPVLLYTGYSDQVNEEKVKAAGIRALIKKPLDLAHFRRQVESLLQHRAATIA